MTQTPVLIPTPSWTQTLIPSKTLTPAPSLTVTLTATITLTPPPTFTPTPGVILYLNQNHFEPERNALRIKMGFIQAAEAEVLIFTLSGRCIWNRTVLVLEPGYRQLSWDGRNQAGERVASGLYFVVLKIDGQKQAVRKLLVSR